MGKIKIGDVKDYEEAIQRILHNENCKTATFRDIPEFKEGEFTWFERFWGSNRTSKHVYELKQFPSKWKYIDISYHKYNDTVYILSADFRFAV